jgi:rhodanese-related sulfurtransferase
VLEGLLVALAGLAFALAANQLSPRGLALGRDYFPGAGRPRLSAPPPTNAALSGTAANPASPSAAEIAAARIRQRGLQLVSSNEVVQWFKDPRYAQGLIVFVDARDDRHYQAGHIPGAWQLDHYRAPNYLPSVLPACLGAEMVVVYCGGGSCEDSEFAAALLHEAGVPGERLFVYVGGMSEWTAGRAPIETGGRASGQLQNVSP